MDMLAYLNGPFSPPPPGIQPNLTHPISTGSHLIITTSIFLAIMIVIVIVRIYTKLRIIRRVAWDDLTCLLGFILTITYYALSIKYVNSAYMGYNSWDVTLGQIFASRFFMLAYAQEIVVPLALGFIKASYFIFYLQIFKPRTIMRIAIWVGGVVCSVFYLLVFALNTYFATPRAEETFNTHYQNPVNKRGSQLAVPMSAIGLVLDLYIITLPIFGVWQLQLSRRRKFSVSLVFLTGASACVAAMLTLKYRVDITNTNDFLRVLVPMTITTMVEMMIGVICTCAPTLSKIVHEYAPQIRSLSSLVQSYFSLTSTARMSSKDSYPKASSSFAYQRRYDVEDDIVVGKDDGGERLTHSKILGNSYDRPYELNARKHSFQTLVGGGRGKQEKQHIDDDGIHLKSEIIQEHAAAADGDQFT